MARLSTASAPRADRGATAGPSAHAGARLRRILPDRPPRAGTLRIALFHNAAGGGPKRAIYHLAKGLVERGHTVDLFAPSTANETYLPLDTVGVVRRRIDAWRMPPAAGVLRPLLVESIARPLRRWAYESWTAARLRSIASQIDAAGYDLAWVDNCQFTETPFIVRAFRRTPVLVYCHEPKREWVETDPLRHWLQQVELASWPRRAYTAVCRACASAEFRCLVDHAASQLGAAALVLTNSHYTRAYLADAYGIDAQVSRLGVDTHQFRPLPASAEPLILSVGRLHPFKRHDLTIHALGRLPVGQRPRFVIVAGRDEPKERRRLSRLAHQAGVAMQCVFNVSDEELTGWYNRALAVAYVSSREPFGLAALEAMACGVPVIGVREGGLQETIVDGLTGWLVDPRAEACAQAISRLVRQPALRRRFGEAGREHVQRAWTWPEAAAAFEQHARRVAASGDAATAGRR